MFISISLSKQKTSLKDLLPKDIELVLSINSDQLIKTILIDALYKTKFDNNDLKLLEKGFESKEVKNYGIEFNQEVVIFYDLWNKNPIQGFLFNISDERAFNRIILKGKNDIIRTNGKQGLILYLKNNASEDLINYSIQFADNLFTNSNLGRTKTNSSTDILNLEYKGNQHTFIQDLMLNAIIKDEEILLNGTSKKNKSLFLSPKLYNMFAYSENEENLEIQSGRLPDSIYQYFDIVLNELGIKIPEITSQQMLIYGISIENINGSTVFLPKFDWILRFDSIININEQLNQINKTFSKMEIVDKHCIKLGGTKYYYQQITGKEIYIGVTESPSIKAIKTQPLPLIKGNPSAVFKIEGKGFIAQFINIMPPVKNTKTFMENVDYFDVHTIDENDENLKIVGEIRLKEGKMMSVELVKYLLLFMK